jgi:hypothetical protein
MNISFMSNFIRICKELDNKGLYKEADKMMLKFAADALMSKKILIPSDVKEIAKEAYDGRLGDIRYGTPKQIEIARQLKTRTYMDLRDVLEIFQYTVRNKSAHLKSKKSRSYLEWTLYGGDAGRDWSERIIRIYLPEKWKVR